MLSHVSRRRPRPLTALKPELVAFVAPQPGLGGGGVLSAPGSGRGERAVTETLRDGARGRHPAGRARGPGGLGRGLRAAEPRVALPPVLRADARLSDRDLDYLTRVDHHDHEALVAVDAGTGDGIGVARYVRTGADVAEPAIVVADDWQGRGVGGLLLDALAERATEEGVRRFEAPVLATNVEAIALLERLGRTRRAARTGARCSSASSSGRGGPKPVAVAAGAVRGGHAAAGPDLARRPGPRRRGEPGTPRRNLIVVGTDGSEHATAALEAAAELAQRSGAALEVVAAHRFLPTDQAALAAALHRPRTGCGSAAGRPRAARPRRPRAVLADVAADEDARLIVVGAGERGKTARRLIGSVADSVAQRASCDVLIVRPRRGGGAGL